MGSLLVLLVEIRGGFLWKGGGSLCGSCKDHPVVELPIFGNRRYLDLTKLEQQPRRNWFITQDHGGCWDIALQLCWLSHGNTSCYVFIFSMFFNVRHEGTLIYWFKWRNGPGSGSYLCFSSLLGWYLRNYDRVLSGIVNSQLLLLFFLPCCFIS